MASASFVERPSDVVISSRIRLARNLAGFPFLTRCTRHQRQAVEHKVRDTILGRASLETGQIHLNEMTISDADLRSIDKVTLLASKSLAGASLWTKQNFEESLGKSEPTPKLPTEK